MGFIDITLIDIIDILVVALIMFQIYRLTRGTNALRIVVGILIVYLLWIVVRVLKMELLSMILGQIIGVGVIALIVVFQQEIRRFLLLLGTQYSHRKNTLFGRWFKSRQSIDRALEWIDPIVNACADMAASKTGALIVAKALQAPVRQIAENAGVDGSIVYDKIRSSRKVGYGYNAYSETYCDMIPSGIVDPTKVTRTALENAASIASCVLTTESLVADKPDPKADAAMAAAAAQGGMGGGMY